MITFFADFKIQEYNIIAIQKPWQNPTVTIILSSYQSNFHLFYKLDGNTQVCFYINNKIDFGSWEVSYSSSDMCCLALTVYAKIKPKLIHIYNIYNSSLILYTSTNSSSTILSVRTAVNIEEKHILLKDFNFYHSYWNGFSRSTQHMAVDSLLKLIEERNLSLTLPQGIIT